METDMVQSVFLAFLKHFQPRFHIHRRITRFRETAILYRSAKPNGLVVEIELSSLNGNITHSEGGTYRILAVNHA